MNCRADRAGVVRRGIFQGSAGLGRTVDGGKPSLRIKNQASRVRIYEKFGLVLQGRDHFEHAPAVFGTFWSSLAAKNAEEPDTSS
jgi:hypothetical protein